MFHLNISLASPPAQPWSTSGSLDWHSFRMTIWSGGSKKSKSEEVQIAKMCLGVGSTGGGYTHASLHHIYSVLPPGEDKHFNNQDHIPDRFLTKSGKGWQDLGRSHCLDASEDGRPLRDRKNFLKRPRKQFVGSRVKNEALYSHCLELTFTPREMFCRNIDWKRLCL